MGVVYWPSQGSGAQGRLANQIGYGGVTAQKSGVQVPVAPVVYNPTPGSGAHARLANQLGLGVVTPMAGGYGVPSAVSAAPVAPATASGTTGGSTAADATATATDTTSSQGELDPWLSYLIQQQQAQRALALQFAQNQANAGLQQTEQQLGADRAAAAEQYNRAYPMMPTQFLQRGMGTSGIANVGIQRFQQDYVAARQKLEAQYQQARTDILAKLAESQITYGTGTVGDLLNVFSSYGPSSSNG